MIHLLGINDSTITNDSAPDSGYGGGGYGGGYGAGYPGMGWGSPYGYAAPAPAAAQPQQQQTLASLMNPLFGGSSGSYSPLISSLLGR